MQKNNSKKARFNGFHGIDLRKIKSGEESISDINNFRICEDGSLKKRSGYKSILKVSEDIRDIWSGTIDGKFTCVYLAREVVYSFDIETGNSKYIMSVYTTSGPAQFFFYKNTLFLSDTADLYKVTNS